MVIFYKKWKKYNEIQLTKKMDLNNRKMKNNPPPLKVLLINHLETREDMSLNSIANKCVGSIVCSRHVNQ